MNQNTEPETKAAPDYIQAAKDKSLKFIKYAYLLIYMVAILNFSIGLTTAIAQPIAFTQFSDFYIGLIFCGFFVSMAVLVQKKHSIGALVFAIIIYGIDSALYMTGLLAGGVTSPVLLIGAALVRVAILGLWIKGILALRELKKLKKLEEDKNALW